MTAEEQAAEIAVRMRADMRKSLIEHGVTAHTVDMEGLLDLLVADGMFHVEHLLTDVRWEGSSDE